MYYTHVITTDKTYDVVETPRMVQAIINASARDKSLAPLTIEDKSGNAVNLAINPAHVIAIEWREW